MLPAVFGLDGDDTAAKIAHQVKIPVKLVSTLPPSIAGSRLLSKLRRLFVKNGGTFLLGSMVKNGKIVFSGTGEVERVTVYEATSEKLDVEIWWQPSVSNGTKSQKADRIVAFKRAD